MLQAYIDESVSTSPYVYVMAGFISTASKWAAFSDEWQQRLDMKPRISYFKWSEAINFNGEFKGISKESHNEKIAMLRWVINEYAIASVSSSLDHVSYHRIFDGMPKELQSPYFFLLYGIVGELAGMQRIALALDEPVDFIFDEQLMEQNKILEHWHNFIKHTPAPSNYIGRVPIFRNDRDILPLQAADFIAGFVRQRQIERMTNVPLFELPKINRKNDVPRLHFLWTDKTLLEIRAEILKASQPRLTFSFGNNRYSRPLYYLPRCAGGTIFLKAASEASPVWKVDNG